MSTVHFSQLFTILIRLLLNLEGVALLNKETCSLPYGNIGMCILNCKGSNFHSNCTNFTTCCPVFERIVTPNNAGGQYQPPMQYVTQPPFFYPSVLPPQYVESTTRPTLMPLSNGMATVKCEEYKHQVIKRASSISTYIFGGTQSESKEFPHMAALGYGQLGTIEYLCGGSLISEQFVLTAAHCLTANLGSLVRVRLGDIDLSSTLDDANPQDFSISQQYVFPTYQPPTQYNDIALIKLDRPAVLNNYVAPICLETLSTLPNINLVATGWGRTELGGEQSDILLKTNLEVFSYNECAQNYVNIVAGSLPFGIIDDSQVCAGSRNDESDTCQGDSGGPLQVSKDGWWYAVGVTSFGKVCGIRNSPAVYTKVSYFVPWIESIVWP